MREAGHGAGTVTARRRRRRSGTEPTAARRSTAVGDRRFSLKSASTADWEKLLLQGEEFIKINSFNRKKRFIKCTADFKQLVWTSAKNHKRSTNKGSVLTAELRSVEQDGVRLKLRLDSRILDFQANNKQTADVWCGCFNYLLSRQSAALFDHRSTTNPVSNGERHAREADLSDDLHLFVRHTPTAKATEEQDTKTNIMDSASIRDLLVRSFRLASSEDLYTSLAVLLQGGTFLRHKPMQKPKTRFVFCTLLLDNIAYSSGQDNQKTRGALCSMDIVNIVTGGSNVVFDGIGVDRSCALSIVAVNASLHLSCEKKEVRDMWAHALRALVWIIANNKDGKIEAFYYW